MPNEKKALMNIMQNNIRLLINSKKPLTLDQRLAIQLQEEEIEQMRLMRSAGASLREIATYFKTSATTVLSYVRGVKPQPDGQTLEYTPVDFIHDWLPALPPEGLPLPRWIATWLRERAETIARAQNEDETQDDTR